MLGLLRPPCVPRPGQVEGEGIVSYDPTTGSFVCVRRTGLPPLASGRVYCPLFGHLFVKAQTDADGQEHCRWSGSAADVADHLDKMHGRRYDHG